MRRSGLSVSGRQKSGEPWNVWSQGSRVSVLRVFGRVRIRTVGILVADLAISPMDHDLATSSVRRLAGLVDRFTLGLVDRARAVSTGLLHGPTIILGYDVTILFAHL